MTTDERHPPAGAGVNVAALANLFSETTNSYKYLYFQAILKRLVATQFRRAIFDIDDIIIEMLIIAWYPRRYFKLSFGVQDKVGSVLDGISLAQDCALTSSERLRSELIKAIDMTSIEQLKRWVPFRLLSAFFANELRGEKDSVKNKRIHELSRTCFESHVPLYRFLGETQIEVHQSWLSYLETNYCVIESWALWKWTEYLLRKNPNVPAISRKIAPPPERESLGAQRRYWSAVIDGNPVRCIYSGEFVSASSFALDHFLPWSFVGHDQLWNLIPVKQEINSGKSNNVPDAFYIDKLLPPASNRAYSSR